MKEVELKIIFVECESDKPLKDILDDLVKSTIKRVVTKYDGILYNEDH